MSYSLNRAQLIGNLTSDPEVRQIPSGKSVATFSIATNQSWTDQNGQKQDKAEFHNVVCWGKLADIVSQYLRKGRKIFVEGRLQTRNWEGEDGVKRYRTEIVADNLIMLDRGDGSGISNTPREMSNENYATTPSTPNKSYATQAAPAPNNAPIEEEVTIDDLPF